LADIKKSIELKKRRTDVWDEILKVKAAVKEKIVSKNRENRIWEKLRIGYGLLLKKPFKFEKSQLLFDQEVLAYLVFWSILDEVAFDYLIMDHSENPESADIKIRGTSNFYIEDCIVEEAQDDLYSR